LAMKRRNVKFSDAPSRHDETVNASSPHSSPTCRRRTRPHTTSVFDVALMGALCRTPLFSGFSAADKKLAEQALEKMGIAHLKNAPYTKVSGDERAHIRGLLSIAASSSQRYTQATHRFR